MKKSLRIPDTNPRKQIATAEMRQRMKKTSLRKKASEVWGSIVATSHQGRTMGLLAPWLQTGNHVVEVDGVKSGEAVKNKI